MMVMTATLPGPDVEEPPESRPRRLRRSLTVLTAAVVLLMVIAGWLTLHWFMWPHTTNPTKVDAVVVLGGGEGERLTRGLQLMDHHVSGVLVLSTGIDWFVPAAQPVHDLCAKGSTKFQLICVAAQPDSTKGEAMTISQMARDHGWHSIALVTTGYHLTRSTRWFDRCYSGMVYPVSAPASASIMELAHEWMGTADQLLVDRHCG